MTLRLSPAGVLDRVNLVGTLAVQVGDALLARPADFACRVSALRQSDGRAVQSGVPHPSGISGFLTLRAGSYYILVEPAGPEFVPQLRPVTIAAPPAAPVFLSAPLRPSPAYPPPANSVILRGTLQWGPAPLGPATAPRPPVRWALVVCTLLVSGTTTVVSTTWTRSNAQGELLLLLPSQPPSTDGVPLIVTARVEIHAPAAPPAPPADPTTLADLPLDYDDDATTIAALPLRRTMIVPGLAAGVEESINHDSYSFTPPGATRPVANHVVLI